MSPRVSDPLRRAVADRAYGVCEYCLVHEEDLYHGCEVDHIVSLKHGGTTVLGNLAYACLHCNRHKGSDLGSIPSVPSRKKSSRRREAEEIEQFIRSRGGKKMTEMIKQRLRQAGCDDWPEE